MAQAKKISFQFHQLALLSGLLGAFPISIVNAQVTPDTTLGEERSTVIRDATVRGETLVD
jgi:hypothetical protein